MKPIYVSLVLVLFSVSCHSMGKIVEDKTPKRSVQSHFVESEDGYQIHYTSTGQGTAVLLIHGYYADQYSNWYSNGIAQELAKTHRVIAIDQRGHGKSDKPKTKEAYGGNMWKDAIAVLDDAKVEKAHLHGYSMGGTIITQILYYQPERVISAIYGGSGVPEYDQEEQKKIKPDLAETAEIKQAEEGAKNKVLEITDPDHFALFALSKNGPDQGESKKIDLTKIKIPVFSIIGEFDSPNARLHRMARELSDFKSLVLPGKGHLSAVTPDYMPPEYLIESVQFIRDHDPAPTAP